MNIAVLVSGNGTNLQALLDTRARGELEPATICGVVSNRPGVPALDRADAAGVESVAIDHKAFADRAGFEAALVDQLERWQTDAVVLAGFMRVLTPAFVDRYPNRIINTHPALCPAFPGIHAPGQALEAAVKVTGCTVHFVDSGVDTGPIIFQAAVDVACDDTVETLHTRIQRHEHALLPRAVQLLAAGRLAVDGRRVRITGS